MEAIKGMIWDTIETPKREDGMEVYLLINSNIQNVPAKIIEKKTFEKDSHCYPLSHWKFYDPQEEDE